MPGINAVLEHKVSWFVSCSVKIVRHQHGFTYSSCLFLKANMPTGTWLPPDLKEHAKVAVLGCSPATPGREFMYHVRWLQDESEDTWTRD